MPSTNSNFSSSKSDETYVACLTPPGRAAIATLVVRGPRAWEIARRLFRPLAGTRKLEDLPQTSTGVHDPKISAVDNAPAYLPAHPPLDRFWIGRLGDGLADEVVLAVKRLEPVPWIEVHCHGGPEAIRLLVETLAEHGVQSCTWHELERKTAGPEAEALAELVKAPTTRTAAILLDQYWGALDRTVGQTVAAIEGNDLVRAREILKELCRWAPLGRHLTAPWRVAVIGPPNVGKSSLINALAGYQRSVVSATPGTTRDVVTTRIAVAGWPVELADTAGLRDPAAEGAASREVQNSAAALEGAGIARARQTASNADLCLWVLDASVPPLWPEPSTSPLRLIVNKIDLPAAWDLARAAAAVHVSARTGAGIPELCRSLADWLVPEPPPPGAAVPFRADLCAVVEKARMRLEQGRLEETSQILTELFGLTR